MCGVAEDGDGPLVPALHGGGPVVEVPLLNVLLQRRLQDVRHLEAPAGESLEQVWDGLPQHVFDGVWRLVDEGVPLDAAPAHIAAHEVLVHTQVHLVRHLVHVTRPVFAHSCEDSEARVGRCLISRFGGVAPLFAHHLGPHHRPDAVRTHQHVAVRPRAVRHIDGHSAVLEDLVADDGPAEVQVVRAEVMLESGLQGGSVDHTSEGKAGTDCGAARVELGDPFVGEWVFEAVDAVACLGARCHDLLSHHVIDGL
mmetsp:Transcript_30527/g.75777  ORF Transcript_30527/g.75777 Transcript_30527/m.75777 type:complete len:254 (+) Transcript_30527:302-1063(+)